MPDLRSYIYSVLANDPTLQSHNVSVVQGGIDQAETYPAITIVESAEVLKTVPPNAREVTYQIQVWTVEGDNAGTQPIAEVETIKKQVETLLNYMNTNTDLGQPDNIRIYWSKVKSSHDIHDATRNLVSKPLNVVFYTMG